MTSVGNEGSPYVIDKYFRDENDDRETTSLRESKGEGINLFFQEIYLTRAHPGITGLPREYSVFQSTRREKEPIIGYFDT